MSVASAVKPTLNRIAFITGGAQGIGRAIATRLARDGHDIAVVDRPAAEDKLKDVINEVESYGRKAISVFAGMSTSLDSLITGLSGIWRTLVWLLDVRDAKQIYAAIDETVDRLGPRLFVSVANAGIAQVKPLLECTPE